MSKRDVELIIRARDNATKTTEKVVQSFDELEKVAQELGSMSDKTGADIEKLVSRINKLGASDQAARAIEQIAGELEQATAAIDRSQREYQEATAVADSYEKQIISAKRALEVLRAEEEAATGSRQRAVAQTLQYVRQIKEAESAIEAMNQAQAADSTPADKAGREKAIADFTQQIETARKGLSDLSAEQTRNAAASEQAAARIKGAEAAIEQLSKAQGKASSTADKLAKEVSDSERAFSALSIQASEAAEFTSNLSKQEATLRAELDSAAQAADKYAAEQKQLASDQKTLADAEQRLASARQTNITVSEKALSTARQSKQSYEENRLRLAELTAQLRATENPTEELTQAVETQRRAMLESKKAWADAQGAYKTFVVQSKEAEAALEKEAAAAAKTAQEERNLKSAKDTMAAVTARLNQLAKEGATDQDKLGNATKRTADKTKQAVTSWRQAVEQLRNLSRESRQSLSLLQRIRGQILSIGAGYVGIFGAQRAVGSIIDAGMANEAINSRFLVAFAGDQAKANEEMQFAKQVAEDLALSYRDLAPEYAKMAIAAKGTALEGQGVRNVFIGMSQAARANKLSNEELKGSFNALTQIISKNTVQAEEIVGQLSDRMPGAFNILAESLGISTAQLRKYMEQGQVGMMALSNLAEEMSKRSAPAMAQALNSLSASVGRFDNALFKLQVKVAESGFLEELAKGLDKAAAAMSDPEVQRGAVELGRLLGELIVKFIELAKYSDEIVLGFKILAGVLALRFFAGLAADLSLVIGGMVSLYNWVSKLSPVVVALTAKFALFAALFATPFIAYWAQKNFPVVRRMGIAMVAGLMDAFDKLKLGWATVTTYLTSVVKEPLKTVVGMFLRAISTILNNASKIADSFGMDSWADKLSRASNALGGFSDDFLAGFDARLAEQTAAIEREAEARREIFTDMIRDTYAAEREAEAEAQAAINRAGGGIATQQLTPSGTPFVPGESQGSGKSDAEKLAESVADKIEQLRQRLAEKIGDDTNLSVQERLAADLKAIESRYAGIYADLKQLGKDQTSEEWKTVDALIAQEQLLARQKAERDQIRADQQAWNKQEQENQNRINLLMQTRRDLMQSAEFAREQGNLTQYEELKTQIDAVTMKLREAIQANISFWQTASDPEKVEAAVAALEAMKLGLDNVKSKGILTGRTVGEALGTQMKSGLDGFLDRIAETGNVMESAKEAFRSFAQDFLMQIAKMIIQQAVFNALQAAGVGGGGGFGGAVLSAFTNHTGGMAGSGSPRSVAAGVFANVVRYHNGGIAGLAPNEVPTILEKGEEVLTENDPRHRANGGAAPQQSVKIVNAIDAGSFVSAGVEDEVGQRSILNFMQANSSAVKSALGIG